MKNTAAGKFSNIILKKLYLQKTTEQLISSTREMKHDNMTLVTAHKKISTQK